MARSEQPEQKKVADLDEAPKGGRRGRWLLGWVVLPGTLLTALFLAGVHVGANHPDLWLSRLISWIGS